MNHQFVEGRKDQIDLKLEMERPAHHSNSVEEHYRRSTLKFCTQKCQASQLISINFGISFTQNLEALLLKAAHREDYSSEIEKVASVYQDTFKLSEHSVQLVIHVLRANFTDEKCTATITMNDIVKHLQSLSASQQHLKQVSVCQVG